ncbi:acyltransferase family protein [Microbacterium sp. TPU 3598]|uniref:acyltransferase family protein n=1 Tax=Microbacterium sp. TPU 3598 TaxID=1938334 RepID=UPI000BBA5018|nr:acyltransferase family protein [Microbacterium sp. TPU 3598]
MTLTAEDTRTSGNTLPFSSSELDATPSRAQATGRRRSRHTRRRTHRAVNGSSEALQLPQSYFPAVDGMRALAILSVLVFHTGIYQNGLFGVDVFFVLSGYLITLTLLREYFRYGMVRLRQFYARRIKRLLPLLLVVLVLTLGAVTAWGTAADLERFSKQAVASLLYVTNWEQILAGQDYWGGFDAINPLGHMWSLAITEQFYLVWPVLLVATLAVGRAWSRRKGGQNAWQHSRLAALLVLVLSGVGVVAGAILPNLMFTGDNADRVYLGTDTHFVGLVAGAAAASVSFLVLQSRARRGVSGHVSRNQWSGALRTALITAVSAGSVIGIVMLSVNASTYEEAWLYEYGFTAVALLSALLILTLTSPSNLLGRVFAFTPFVELGKVSYTLFLVHLPLYWVILSVGSWTSAKDLLILGVPLSIVIASGLHHLVAEPVRLRQWQTKGRSWFTVALAATVASVIVVPGVVAELPRGSGDVRVLTLGDSLANDFASALSTNAADSFTVVDGGLPGCGIAGSTGQKTAVGITQMAAKQCNPWQERWQEALSTGTPDVIVVNIAWDAVTQIFGDTEVDLTDPVYAAEYRQQLTTMADLLDGTDATVLIANSRLYNAVVTPAQALAFNALLEDVLADYPEIVLVDLQEAVCTPDDCPSRGEDGSDWYLDDRVHFSPAGKQVVSSWLTEEILAHTSGGPATGGEEPNR